MQILASAEGDKGFTISPNDWDSTESSEDRLVWRDDEANMGIVLEKDGSDDEGPLYSLLGLSFCPLDESNNFFYDLNSKTYSNSASVDRKSGWEFVDWDSWKGEWGEDRYGDRYPVVEYLDTDNIGPVKVPSWFVERIDTLNEEYEKFVDIAYELKYPEDAEAKRVSAEFELMDDSERSTWLQDVHGLSEWDVPYVLDEYNNM